MHMTLYALFNIVRNIRIHAFGEPCLSVCLSLYLSTLCLCRCIMYTVHSKHGVRCTLTKNKTSIDISNLATRSPIDTIELGVCVCVCVCVCPSATPPRDCVAMFD